MQPHCPFCRDEFSLQDIRILRVDNDAPSSTTVAPQLDTQVQRLLDDIAQTASGGGTVEEMERVIVLCDAYHNAQPRSSPVRDRPETRKATDWSLQHTPLGVSYLLLSTLLEAQRKLFSQADQLSELTAARDDIRDRLSLELEASRLQYQNSERARDNEKEAALSNEEALRVQYKKMNALWIWSVTRLSVAGIVGSRADSRRVFCSKVGRTDECGCIPRLTCGLRWNRHSGHASLCMKN
jgi:hypothetical protein